MWMWCLFQLCHLRKAKEEKLSHIILSNGDQYWMGTVKSQWKVGEAWYSHPLLHPAVWLLSGVCMIRVHVAQAFCLPVCMVGFPVCLRCNGFSWDISISTVWRKKECACVSAGFNLEWQAYGSIGPYLSNLVGQFEWWWVKRKIMEAMLMNGKEKHAVFDWSDIVSMSQSEFV